MQNSNIAVNNLTLMSEECQMEEGVCAIEMANPKAGVCQILKLYLEYFSSHVHFSKLKRKT